MSYVDKTLTCRECGRPFDFTAGEQEFYAARGLLNEPSRCPECRAARKAAGGAGDRGRGTGGFGERGGFQERDYGAREQRQMFTVTCSSCGREAEVPFRPTSGKPVYCRDCFDQVRSTRV
jgi:CxxC-x17-CxxC domain-containing protein